MAERNTRYPRAKCSEPIRLKLRDFLLREKSRTGLKTSELAMRMGRSGPGAIYQELSEMNAGAIPAWEKLLRMVEALDHDVDIVIKPRLASRELEVAA